MTLDTVRQMTMSETAETPAKQERRSEILDAAFEEFSLNGYAGTSMAAIARRARASKETLYAWFENKETLFNTLLATRLDAMGGRSAAAASENPSAAHVLPVVAEDIIRFMLVVEPLSQAMAAGPPSDGALRLVGKAIADERQRFVALFEFWRARGEIAFDDDPFEIASLFVAMSEGEWTMRVATGLLDELTDQIIQEHAKRVTRIFLKGLAPDAA